MSAAPAALGYPSSLAEWVGIDTPGNDTIVEIPTELIRKLVEAGELT